MKKLIIGGVIILAIGVMIFLNIRNDGSSDTGTASAAFGGGKAQKVSAVEIATGTITSSITITGTVEEINNKEVVATAPIEVLEVLVKKGDTVKKGDSLFTADLADLKKELDQLKINYEIQKLTLEKLETLAVSTDDSSMEVALQLAKITLDSAQRFYDTQKDTTEKNQALFDSGIISQAELEASISTLTEAESQLNTAKLNHQRSVTDLTSFREQSANTDRSTEIDIQIQQMNLQSLEMNIQTLEDQIGDIEELTISPMDGVVTQLNIEDGETASTLQPLAVIKNIDELRIAASIREYDIKDVETGQEVIITGDAIGKGETVIGTVSYIAPVATEAIINNRQVTAIEVEINIIEGVDLVKPGYTAECEIVTSKLSDVVIATYEMLQKDSDDNDVVFVVVDGVAEERIVELGSTSDFDAEVIRGLEAGEMVIVNPSLSLFDGSKVEVLVEEEE